MRILTVSTYAFALCLLTPGIWADVLTVGALSYDTFVPAGNGSPGIYAFDLADLSGAYDLPPDFPVSDGLTLGSAVLTLTLADATREVFDLGDIAPGFLVDVNGNPVVQVPGNEGFTSAELVAMLSTTTFILADGAMFTATSASLDALLLPSSGSTLSVDVDRTIIDVSGSIASLAPEPATLSCLLSFFLFFLTKRISDAHLKRRP